MQIATYTNTRVAYTAQFSLEEAFKVAYRAGCVMGFALTSLALLILTILIAIYREMPIASKGEASELYARMMEAIAGYGLGGSTVALFARVGGGIYTKAADVGADLVGKMENDLPEDSPKNPATIADNVGDNVGDIAGMGADLFGSFAESTCAALVIMAQKMSAEDDGGNLFYPLVIAAFGILGSFLTSFFATNIMTVDQNDKIESTLKWQLIISSIILTPLLYAAAVISLPDTYHIVEGQTSTPT
jgi:Na+/H+-translocating membrane pyrophosphatase